MVHRKILILIPLWFSGNEIHFWGEQNFVFIEIYKILISVSGLYIYNKFDSTLEHIP